MIELSRFFDAYGRQARLYPALLTLLPLAALVVAVFPVVLTSGIGGSFLAAAASCGLVFLLADVSRTAGKRLEPKLLHLWGGWPTTLWLRHNSQLLPAATKARYHAFLSGRIPGLTLPNQAEELNDPAQADDTYRSATQWLQEQCRGPEFALVHKENAAYGFRRNLLGLRPYGLSLSLLCLVSLTGVIVSRVLVLSPPYFRSIQSIPVAETGAWVFVFLATVSWLFIRPQWVRGASDTYSRALLACCDKIQ
jgi:hypothetical protein